MLLEGYYYSGGSGPGPLDEAFLQQDHRFVTDSVTKDVLNEPSTRAALSSELGYALEYTLDGATSTGEPGTKGKVHYYHLGMLCVQTESSELVSFAAGHYCSAKKVTGGRKSQP